MQDDPYEFQDESLFPYEGSGVRRDEMLGGDDFIHEQRARTQAGLADEQAAVDAAMSEAEKVFKTLQIGDHSAEELELGFGLAWWEEDEGVPVIDIAVALTNEACSYASHVKRLAEHGLPLSTASSQITLNHFSGPLVVGGLQLLGVLHPHLRDDVKAIIKGISEQVPDATDEEERLMSEAIESINAEQANMFKEALLAEGVEVMTPDEIAEEIHERAVVENEASRQAGLN